MLDESSDVPSMNVRRLAEMLVALPEPSQRVAVFRRSIESLPPRQAAAIFQALHESGVRTRTRSSRILCETSMLCLLRAQWSEAHLEATRGAAADAGLELAFLLLSNVSDSAELPSVAEPIPNYTGSERTLTLGERRALARQPDRHLLNRAMLDPHPMVIARVLENPRIREGDIIFMASRRRTSPAVLREIATHTKWRLSRRVAFSLLCNPVLPIGLGLSLLAGLDPGRLAQIAEDGSAAGLLRHVAREFLRLREESCQHPRQTADT